MDGSGVLVCKNLGEKGIFECTKKHLMQIICKLKIWFW